MTPFTRRPSRRRPLAARLLLVALAGATAACGSGYEPIGQPDRPERNAGVAAATTTTARPTAITAKIGGTVTPPAGQGRTPVTPPAPAVTEPETPAGDLSEVPDTSPPVTEPLNNDGTAADGGGDTAASTSSTTSTTVPVGNSMLRVRWFSETLGVVVDGDYHTLYALALAGGDADDPGRCVDACLERWIPALANEVSTEPEIDGTLVGAVQRPNGSWQLTYNGHVLYRRAAEEPYSVDAHGTDGTWFAIDVTGTLIGV